MRPRQAAARILKKVSQNIARASIPPFGLVRDLECVGSRITQRHFRTKMAQECRRISPRNSGGLAAFSARLAVVRFGEGAVRATGIPHAFASGLGKSLENEPGIRSWASWAQKQSLWRNQVRPADAAVQRESDDWLEPLKGEHTPARIPKRRFRLPILHIHTAGV
jgi:hypothetical protein